MLKVETFFYQAKQGWSVPAFPALDSEFTVIFFFAAKMFQNNLAPINELCDFYRKSSVLGCSTGGEIFQTNVNDNSIVVAVAKFEQTSIQTTYVSVEDSEDSFAAGAEIAKQLWRSDLKHIFVLSDGMNVNGTELINGIHGLNRDQSVNVIVTGGLAGDGTQFKSTWTFTKEQQLRSKAVVAAGFYGEHFNAGFGSGGGWDTFGPERIITKSKKNVLFEIDHQPALVLYKKYLGKFAKDLPYSALSFPLGIRQDLSEQARIVRTVLSIDELAQSMTFAGDVPEGWSAQLMTATFDRLIEGASVAGALAHDCLIEGAGTLAQLENSASDVLAIAISCVGRRLVLGQRIEEELEATLEKLPHKTHQVGFYSYGEISPSGLKDCDVHHQTMTLTAFSEK